jgi:hypothetical protein
VVLAVDLSFGLVDGAILGVVIVLVGAQAVDPARLRGLWARRPRRPRAPGEEVGEGEEGQEGQEGQRFAALGELYPLLSERATRLLEQRFGYVGPAAASGSLATGEEAGGLATLEALRAQAVRRAPHPSEPWTGSGAAAERPLVRLVASGALVLAVFLFLLIL